MWPCVDLLLCMISATCCRSSYRICRAACGRCWPCGWEGTLLGLNGCQDTVTLALAHSLRGPRNLHTLRRLQRELTMQIALIPGGRVRSWRWSAASPRCCSGCAGGGCPRAGGNWTRHRWYWQWIPRPEGPRKQDELVALVISVVYRQQAIPVPWHIVGAQARESWIDHFCRLLRLLAPAVPGYGAGACAL